MKKIRASKKSTARSTAHHAPVAPDAATAFEATQADRDALAPTELVPVNVDVGAAALIALGAMPRIREHAAALATLPSDVPSPARVQQCALAAEHANAIWLHADAGPDEVQRLVAEATPRRNQAVSVLQMMAAFEVVDQSVVDGLRGGTGYLNLASDLHASEAILRAKWPQIEGGILLTLEDLDAMRSVAARLNLALALRDSGNDAVLNKASNDRQRAFTLLARVYNEVRRGISWIRWYQGDADQIVPSLWLRQGTSKRSNGEAASAPATPVAPVTATTPAASAHEPPAAAGPLGSPFIS